MSLKSELPSLFKRISTQFFRQIRSSNHDHPKILLHICYVQLMINSIKRIKITSTTKPNSILLKWFTLGLLFVLKDVGNRAFYRWISQNHRHLFPSLPEPTRLFRLFNSHQHLIDVFMALVEKARSKTRS